MSVRHLTQTLLCAGLALLPTVTLGVPNVFAPGQTINAADINANFQALEDRISAAGVPGPADLIRASAATTAATPSAIIFTVPTTAVRPYVLRQVYYAGWMAGFLASQGSCSLSSGSFVVPLVGTPTSITGTASTGMGGVVITNMAIPFNPGEAITVSCGYNTSIAGYMNFAIILSK
jgi:hypothetical protein